MVINNHQGSVFMVINFAGVNDFVGKKTELTDKK